MGLSQSVPAANEAVVAAVAGGALLLLLLRRRKPAADEPESRAEVAALYIHPVKSCAPVQLDAASLDRLGFVDDRRLMVVSAEPLGGNHSFVTQRQEPRLCLVRAELSAEVVRLSAPGKPLLAVPLRPPHPQSELRVRVWSDTGLRAVDLGEAAAAWLSSFLGADEEPHRRVRLVSCASSSFSRPLDARYAPLALRWAWGGPQVGFADGFPLLLISTASLEALNGSLSAMAEPMPMGRFRPNIVAAGCEDTWRRIRIGDMVFRVVKGCSRCKITTTDQATGEQGSLVGADGAPEPLSALRAAGRGVGSEVYFGQNLAHERPPPRHVAFDDHTCCRVLLKVHEWPLPLLERAARWLRGEPQLPVVCAGDRIEARRQESGGGAGEAARC
ncbi:MOSC domain-containing protein [Emiliania huxleyi CCMP1516]|uniref:MOSC domain-containing protein n=3 Tax=Emiliania huxleyi TaxID=2903 RepID=A0A0D3KI06_EMIH1|nr:MOSC domain-containing protein [Emiliania huxleyi CCMP1516]EOD35391.1 MOSC domain-containing protein [Emiliania huxleyi CCMP1516]|eukprot:XP_005787820.1 MOSC domain-containing protein [Emiliania huxleyi CCMP1516]